MSLNIAPALTPNLVWSPPLQAIVLRLAHPVRRVIALATIQRSNGASPSYKSAATRHVTLSA